MHQVRRPKVQGPDVKLAMFLFVAFGIGFPIVYLRWRYPIILFVCCTHKSSIFVLFDKIQCILDSTHIFFQIYFLHTYLDYIFCFYCYIQVSYGTLILNIAWMDLCLLFSQYTRSGIAMYATGLAMQVQYWVIYIYMYIYWNCNYIIMC